MKIIQKVSLMLLIGLSSLTAQSGVNPVFSKDTLKILAIMVDFQSDKYDATIGTGKFGSHYTKDYQNTIIDPLPHNKSFFDDHLLFASNYFRKVSKGKLNIKYNTLPDVITLSGMMRDYSPVYKSKDYTLLGNLSQEAWSIAAQKYPAFNFKDYDLFIIFHAGVSNSLTTGSYEINRNLPALYLSPNAFKTIFGGSFTGLVNTPSGKAITNSIIMPETESRELTSVDGSISLLQISINGELVSNIASFLGLPDLYNTDTGISAIGRFGLMDGQAMVASLGVFPPEPSAWEKIYLGWVTPATVNLKNITPTLTASSAAGLSDTTIIKIPINDYEYYLVENRQQDALKNDVNIIWHKGGQIINSVIPFNAANGFSFLDSNIVGGNVIDTDEFDASTAGSGIVIWHIDEQVISQKIVIGGINNDKLKKGVSVVEADGITDIGEIIKSIFGDIIGDGTQDDFWSSGNKTKYYKNIFSDDTKPSAKANNGSNSFIVMQNFSASAPKMSFSLSYGGSVVPKYKTNIAQWSQSASSVIPSKEGSLIFYYAQFGNNLYKYDTNGNIVKTFNNFSSLFPVYFTKGDTLFIAGSYNNVINILNISSGIIRQVITSETISAPLVNIVPSSGNPFLLFGCNNGNVYKLVNYTTPLKVLSASSAVIQIAGNENYLSCVTQNGIVDNYPSQTVIPYKVKKLAITKDQSGNYVSIILTDYDHCYIISKGSIISDFRFPGPSPIDDFILADIAGTGETNIVFASGHYLTIINQKGTILENYPYCLPSGNYFSGKILSMYYDSDTIADLLTFTTSGDIYCINGKTGKPFNTFSLSTGATANFASLHPIDNSPRVPISDDLALTVCTSNGNIYTWDLLLASGQKLWYSTFGDYGNTSYLAAAQSSTTYSQLLPESRTYNWPNPVYGSTTNIRFTANENSAVNVRVFDMGGQIVAEFNKDVLANIDSEVVLNVASLKSGVYFGRVEAVSSSGKSEFKIIKIAVIK